MAITIIALIAAFLILELFGIFAALCNLIFTFAIFAGVKILRFLARLVREARKSSQMTDHTRHEPQIASCSISPEPVLWDLLKTKH
jgi:hypothetical protein